MNKENRFIFMSVFALFIYVLVLLTTSMISLAIINSCILSISLDEFLLRKIK